MTLFPTYFYKIMKAANPLVARVAASFYLFKLSKSGLYSKENPNAIQSLIICGNLYR